MKIDTNIALSRLSALVVVLLLLCLNALDVDAQQPTGDVTYEVEARTTFSSGNHTPFWLVNNQQGLSSLRCDNGLMRASVIRSTPVPTPSHRFTWGVGVDVAAAYNFTSTFIVQQLYGELRYRSLDLTIGSKEHYEPLLTDQRLSSGDMLYSGNSRPIPQVRLSMPDYQPVPFTHRWVWVKGYGAYGMFTDDSWQKDFSIPESRRTEHVMFHSKGGFMRIGDPARHSVVVEGGLEMAAQFGGRTIHNGVVRKMPSSLKDWFRVFFPSSGAPGSPIGDRVNIVGNHVGQWCASLLWQAPSRKWNLRGYFEHYFEDQSMMFFEYKWIDMLLGLESRLPANPVVSRVVYEYLHTKDGSGPVFWDSTAQVPGQVSGRDDYYNHDYYTGWQHWGMGIGNPLLLSPIYNTDGVIQFRHNRIIAHHVGWEGEPCSELSYRVLMSYTRSWGSYDMPTPKIESNFNTLLEVTYHPRRFEGWSAMVSLATDGGSMIGSSYGAMLTLRKSGIICKNKSR